jgi:mannitol-specific phosphotransferase system IIBC component
MDITIIRVLVCVLLGALLTLQGCGMLVNSESIIMQGFSLIVMTFGLLIVIYGFSPAVVTAIVNAIIEIVTIPLKAIFH